MMGSSLVGENVLCRFGLEVVAGEYIGGNELCTSEINSAVLPSNATGLSTMTQRSEQCMGWVGGGVHVTASRSWHCDGGGERH